MTRPIRLTLAVLALLALVAGSALATSRPAPSHPAPFAASPAASPGGGSAKDDEETEEPEDTDEAEDATPLTADAASALVERLAANGLETDAATLTDLASRYGVGGAVRLLGWSDASGKTVDELSAMRDGGMGWGQIAKQLGVHPGIGTWMRGGTGDDESDADDPADAAASPGAAGRANAPGQQKQH